MMQGSELHAQSSYTSVCLAVGLKREHLTLKKNHMINYLKNTTEHGNWPSPMYWTSKSSTKCQFQTWWYLSQLKFLLSTWFLVIFTWQFFVGTIVHSSLQLSTTLVVIYISVAYYLVVYGWAVTSVHVHIDVTIVFLCLKSHKFNSRQGTEDMEQTALVHDKDTHLKPTVKPCWAAPSCKKSTRFWQSGQHQRRWQALGVYKGGSQER